MANADMFDHPSVLIVEDDSDLRMLLADQLQEEGYVVIQAGDGETGMTFLRRDAVDVVLLDLWLPGMDGWAFRAEQLADGQIRGVPVIVMTADDRPQARAVDASAVLRKPFGTDVLLKNVREVLADRRAEAKEARERLSSAVTLLVNAVGHEIANPLMALIRGLESVQNERAQPGKVASIDPEELLHHCWSIARSLRTLRGLACPSWSRDSDVDLRAILQSAVASLQTGEIELVLDGERQAWVRGDPLLLLYVCTAVIQNAMEAVPFFAATGSSERKRKSLVEVRLSRAQSVVTLDVKDSGAPIARDELDRIFVPDNPGRGRAWGAGLRLWFVRQIVETLGGDIEISNVERGVRCRVRIPTRNPG